MSVNMLSSHLVEGRRASLLDDMFDLGSAKGMSGEPRIAALDGLRGFAALLVFLVHYAALVLAWLPTESLVAALARGIHAAGHLGVYLFFVISGYLIYGSLLKRVVPFPAFAKRRVQRIYPTFFLILVLYLLLSAAFPEQSKIPAEPLQATLYVLANALLLPGVFDITPIITVAWSLSYEILFYLVMPVIVGALALRQRHAGMRITVFALIWIMIPILFPAHFAGSAFIVGIMLVEAKERGPDKGMPAWMELFTILAFAGASALYSAVYLDIVEGPYIDIWKNVILFGASYFFILAALQERGWLSSFFRQRLVRYFGNISYSFYLIHSLCLHVTFLAFGLLMPEEALAHSLWFWVLLPPALLTSTLGAAGLFLLVERPFSLDGVGVWSLLQRWRRSHFLPAKTDLESRLRRSADQAAD